MNHLLLIYLWREMGENVYCMTNINDCVDNLYEKIFNVIGRSSNLIKGNAKNKRLKE